jgi:hypothetical protein
MILVLSLETIELLSGDLVVLNFGVLEASSRSRVPGRRFLAIPIPLLLIVTEAQLIKIILDEKEAENPID